MPATKPATRVTTKKPTNNQAYWLGEKENSLPDTCWNIGSNNKVNRREMIKDIKESRMASQRNCLTSEVFSAPNTFRTPISIALFEDRAVERFIKLTQAMSKVTMAIDMRMYK